MVRPALEVREMNQENPLTLPYRVNNKVCFRLLSFYARYILELTGWSEGSNDKRVCIKALQALD